MSRDGIYVGEEEFASWEADKRQRADEAHGARDGRNGDLPRIPRIPRKGDAPTLDAAALQGLAGEVVGVIGPHSEADPAALLIQFLSAFGSAVGRGPGFRAEADHHGTNLFAVLVGETAKGRKGTSWGHIRRLFEHADEEWAINCVKSGLSSGEGLIWQIRDQIAKLVAIKEGKPARPTGEYVEEIADPGVEDKRLLVQEGEFAQALKVLSREGNTLSPIIRDAWDGRTLSPLTKNSPAKATDPHISIVAHVTADELRRLLSATELANGFANRFLFVSVRRSKALPDGGRLPDGELERLAGSVRQALKCARSAGVLERDDQARELWYEVYERLSEGRPGLLGSVTARAEAQTMRLAVLYALLDLSAEVRREHLEAALALWRYCEQSAAYVFGNSVGDPFADELLTVIRHAGEAGITRSEIREHFQRHKSSERTERALTALLELGLVRVESEPTGGRPAERWSACAVSAISAVSPGDDLGPM